MHKDPAQAARDAFHGFEKRLKHVDIPPGARKAAVAVPVAVAVAGALWWWRTARQKSHRRQMRQGLWLRQLFEGVELETAGHELLAFIRDTLLGQRRSDLLRLLGHPQAGGDDAAVFADPPRDRERSANRWYYRLDRVPGSRQPSGAALVVEFDDRDKVNDARFLLPPES